MGRSRETDEWGVGEKVSVDVSSLEKLAQQIKDDMDTFHTWVETWQQTGAETNPSNAQFTGLYGGNSDSRQAPAGAGFNEAVYVEGQNNQYYYGQMRGLIMLIQMGLGSLHGGANFLASMYPGVDGYNNVQLGTVEDMFPVIPLRDPSTIDTNNPPGQNWTRAGDGQGWDTDGDGLTNIPFAQSGGPPPGLDRGESANRRPDAVAGSTHGGYQQAIDTQAPEDEGGLDGATQRDLQNNIDEGESNMPIVRGLEDGWDWAYETAESIENVTDGEDDPRVVGPW